MLKNKYLPQIHRLELILICESVAINIVAK